MPYVFAFDHKHRRPPMDMKDLLGGKGANLAEMTSVLKLPVPPGFTISTDACRAYMHGGWPPGLDGEIARQIKSLEAKMGRRLGDPEDPLLVSVRSGAKFSMPGMMDTVLNLGLNDKSVKGLAKVTSDERFAYDSYRRFISMYGRIVLGLDGEPFEHALEEAKRHAGVATDAEVSAAELKKLCGMYKGIVKAETNRAFPQDPTRQLRGAIEAVFRSWNGARAIAYRVRERISHDLGTAVNVQAMVFGNRDDNSGTGVGFTRNAATGENRPYGDFLVNAQGEDVVAGIRNTEDLDAMARQFPTIHSELLAIFRRLERHYQDMCDTEFTIEQGKLWMLQTRVGKRTGAAALRMAVDMTRGSGKAKDRWRISRREAIMRITGDHLDQVLHPHFAASRAVAIAKGLGASPGAAVGRVYFTADEAADAAERGEPVILVRNETSPEDVHGMMVSEGILTARGGLVSHAAVVARGWGTPAVVGAEAIQISGKQFSVGDVVVMEGDTISLDGSTGEIILGELKLAAAEPPPEFHTLLGWADDVRRGKLKVRANADNGADAKNAREFGAEGIGLCRTEHMFLGEDRLPVVRQMILAHTPEDEAAALEELRRVQKADFMDILEAMDGLPVTVRLLDPPLHEFLPKVDELEVKAATTGLDARGGGAAQGRPELARVQPHAGHARRAPRRGEAGALRHAGAGLDGGRGRAALPRGQPDRGGDDPPHGHPRGDAPGPHLGGGRHRRGDEGREEEARGHHRNDDRDATRGHPRRRDRGGVRLLLLRHQRPHPDDVRLQPGRHREPDDAGLPGAGPAQAQPVRDHRPDRRGRAGDDGRAARALGAQGPQARGLRRAWRRSGVDPPVLRGRAGLRELLALPGAHRPARRGPGRDRWWQR